MTYTNTAFFLKNFYVRSGKKFQFRNGKSSSDLAFEIWEILGNRSFELSTFSRILSGERLFTEEQLLAFAQAMNLSSLETAGLIESSMKDFLQRNFSSDSIQRVFNNNSSRYSSIIKTCRSTGQLQQAISIAKVFESLSARGDEDEYAALLNEKIRTYSEYCSKVDIRKKVWRDNNVVKRIAIKKHNHELLLETIINEGMVLYIEEKWNESYEKLRMVSSHQDSKIIRAQIIIVNDLAMLGDYEKFCSSKNDLKSLIECNDGIEENDYFAAVEAIARGQVIFGEYSEAEENISFLKKSKLPPFCRSQLRRLLAFAHFSKRTRAIETNMDYKTVFDEDESIKQFRRHHIQVNRILRRLNLS
ncbi:MAG: hypothetical protein ACOZAN_05085 [Patescibacteria group bacterium]